VDSLHAISLCAAALLAGCGLDPAKIPGQPVYATDGSTVAAEESLRFAVVGSTRPTREGAAEAVIADLAAAARDEGLAFVVLLGDQVPRSTPAAWRAFHQRWAPVVEAGAGLVPVAGPGELRGDRHLVGFAAAFPGAGPEGRTDSPAGWSSFDVEVGEGSWRFVVVETDRKAMGDRWAEQLFWLPRAMSAAGSPYLLLFLPTPATTLTGRADPDAGVVLEAALDEAPADRLMAVFQGGAPSNELLLPGGPWGEARVVAGNGGVPGADLALAWPLRSTNPDLALDSAFREALLAELLVPPGVDPPPVLDGTEFPVQGWWKVELQGTEIDLAFRFRRPDGSLREITRHRFRPDRGWRSIGAGP